MKRTKSEVSVLNLSVEDPSSHDGMIRISQKLIPYLPKMPGGVAQKTVLFGDQLYVERGQDQLPGCKKFTQFIELGCF